MMKLGILGGTFNPIHQAHLRIAEAAREAAGLHQVLFIPAADPPHKRLAGEVPFVQRYEMVQLAIADNPGFSISDIEARREGKSYTVENVVAAAGCSFRMSQQEMVELIQDAGFKAAQRDTAYRILREF